VCDLFTLTEPVDKIISNVPYEIAEPCARHMIGLARRKVALVLPMTFWESTQPPSSGGTMPYGWFIFERGFRGVTSAMRLPLKNR
jgi:hypothetical protein